MDEIDKIAVGKRLKEFGSSKFKNMKEFAEYLGFSPGTFQTTYLKGRSLPGAKIIGKLVKIGCDINWLLHGEKNEVLRVTDTEDKYNKQLKEENKKLNAKLESIRKLARSKSS